MGSVVMLVLVQMLAPERIVLKERRSCIGHALGRRIVDNCARLDPFDPCRDLASNALSSQPPSCSNARPLVDLPS